MSARQRPRGPQPLPVHLAEEERLALEQLVHRHHTPQQLALRARIVLAAAAGLNHRQIARQLGVSLDAARLWRRRWLHYQPLPLGELPVEARLADLPRPGVPPRITTEQWCQIIALACEIPSDSEVPLSQWDHRAIAAEIMRRGIVDQISARHVGRFLKDGRPQAASHSLLAHPRSRRT
jgi:putative transposase